MRLELRAKLATCALIGSILAPVACGSAMRETLHDARAISRDVSLLERQTIEAINETREGAGLGPLVVSAALTRIARAHSEYQARTGRSGHVGAGGSSAADRARAGGVDYHVVAENVAMHSGYSDPVDIAVKAWMKSAAHRENILNPVVTQTGVGVAVGANGRIYFTQLFLDPSLPR